MFNSIIADIKEITDRRGKTYESIRPGTVLRIIAALVALKATPSVDQSTYDKCKYTVYDLVTQGPGRPIIPFRVSDWLEKSLGDDQLKKQVFGKLDSTDPVSEPALFENSIEPLAATLEKYNELLVGKLTVPDQSGNFGLNMTVYRNLPLSHPLRAALVPKLVDPVVARIISAFTRIPEKGKELPPDPCAHKPGVETRQQESLPEPAAAAPEHEAPPEPVRPAPEPEPLPEPSEEAPAAVEEPAGEDNPAEPAPEMPGETPEEPIVEPEPGPGGVHEVLPAAQKAAPVATAEAPLNIPKPDKSASSEPAAEPDETALSDPEAAGEPAQGSQENAPEALKPAPAPTPVSGEVNAAESEGMPESPAPVQEEPKDARQPGDLPETEPGETPKPADPTEGLPQGTAAALKGMSISDAQLQEAVDYLYGNPNGKFAPYMATYHPGLTERAVADLLDHFTSDGTHRKYAPPKQSVRAMIPPAFKLDQSPAIWSRAVIDTLGYPFINFTSPSVMELLRGTDPARVRDAYRRVKRMFRQCGLKRPVDTLKAFAHERYRNCVLNALVVDSQVLYSAQPGDRVSVQVVDPYNKRFSTKGGLSVPVDFLVTFYGILSPVAGSRQYAEASGKTESDYRSELASTGMPPVYILNPKKNQFRRGPKGSILHRLFSSKTAPVLVRTRVATHDGGFLIPEREADMLLAE